MIQSVRLRVLPLVALLAVLAAPAVACPLQKLSRLVEAPLTPFKKIEVPPRRFQSTEGGMWQVYLQRDGKPHTIVRTDFGETGQWRMRASFLDAQTFAIAFTEQRYAVPLGSKGDVVINKTTRTAYFFCDGVHVSSLQLDGDDADQAARLRNDLSAPEISLYLKRLP